IRKEMPCGYEGARRFEVLRFNWVMGNHQLKNMSLYTITCFTGLISSRVTGSHTFIQDVFHVRHNHARQHAG
ncbi:MAG: hypothetical protein KBI41_10060, partial [Kiritimatiellae bacterium]|nr:hypothetical protein [Kiritimatiellia bacterium]